jgi:hypothetical protein
VPQHKLQLVAAAAWVCSTADANGRTCKCSKQYAEINCTTLLLKKLQAGAATVQFKLRSILGQLAVAESACHHGCIIRC